MQHSHRSLGGLAGPSVQHSHRSLGGLEEQLCSIPTGHQGRSRDHRCSIPTGHLGDLEGQLCSIPPPSVVPHPAHVGRQSRHRRQRLALVAHALPIALQQPNQAVGVLPDAAEPG